MLFEKLPPEPTSVDLHNQRSWNSTLACRTRRSERPEDRDEQDGDDAEQHEHRQPELPVVAEAVAARAPSPSGSPGSPPGVRKDAAAETATAIRTGSAETSISAAADSATGITISAVAMLEISWPSAAVSRNRPSRSACGPASPTTSTRRVGEQLGGARGDHRRRERDHPADEHDRRPRDAALGLLDGQHAQQDHRAGREQARDRGGHGARGQQHDHRGQHRQRRLRARAHRHRPAARAPAGRRPAPAGRRGARRARPRCPCSSSVSPSASTVSPTSSPWRCTARITRSPLGVTMPGKTVSPASSERGGITTSATPERRVSSSACASAYCAASVRAWSLKSGAIERGWRSRQQPVAEQQRDRDHAHHQRHADERELEEAEAAGGVGDDHVDRRPGQRQQRAGVRAEGQREQQPRRRAARAHRQHDRDRRPAPRPRR